MEERKTNIKVAGKVFAITAHSEEEEQLYHVTIPCNTTASVIWKDQRHEIGSGSYCFSAIVNHDLIFA